MTPDGTLLRNFDARGDDSAFRALVDRHLPLVHSVARRVTANEDLARDVTQETFIRLAKKAGEIPATVPLSAWLHRTTHSLAANLVRNEIRRKRREVKSADPFEEVEEVPAWDRLAPVIDELVDQLPAVDRQMILLRFYHGHTHAAVAARVGLNEEAARRRSSRAIEKLRGLLARRGITTTASALGCLLPAHAVAAAPAGLSGEVATVALASHATVSGTLAAKLIIMNQTTKTTVAVAILIALAGTYAYRVIYPTIPGAPADWKAPESLSSVGKLESGADGAAALAARPHRPDREKKDYFGRGLDEITHDELFSKVKLKPGQSLVMGGYPADNEAWEGDQLREYTVITPTAVTAADGTRKISFKARSFALNAEEVAQAGLESLSSIQVGLGSSTSSPGQGGIGLKVGGNGKVFSPEDLKKADVLLEHNEQPLKATLIDPTPGAVNEFTSGVEGTGIKLQATVGRDDEISLETEIKRKTK